MLSVFLLRVANFDSSSRMSGEEKSENGMESVLQNEVTAEGKNKNTVKCDRCPSVILKGNFGTLKESPVSKSLKLWQLTF